MPFDDRFRFNENQGRTPTRPPSRPSDPQASINVIQSDSLRPLTALEHRQLMTQCDDFGLRSGLAAKPNEKGIEH
jgi:hypothetical protein